MGSSVGADFAEHRRLQQFALLAMNARGPLLVTLLAASAAFAHGGGNGDPLSLVELHLEPGEVQLGIDLEAASASARSDDNSSLVEHVDRVALRSLLAFSPLDRLTVSVQLPVVRRSWSLAAADERPTAVDVTGLGDANVGVRYLAVHGEFHLLGISIGASLPTGNNSVLRDGERLDEHAQPGIGAVAPWAGLEYQHSHARWIFAGSLAGRIPLRNGAGYLHAPSFAATIRSSLRVINRLSLGAGLDLRFAGHDLSGLIEQENAGGLVLWVTTSARVKLTPGLSLCAGLELPAVTHLFGAQSDGPMLMIGAQFLLEAPHPEEHEHSEAQARSSTFFSPPLR